MLPFHLALGAEVERIQGRLKKRRNPVTLRPDLPFSSDILMELVEAETIVLASSTVT
jgi:hypothetical protein